MNYKYGFLMFLVAFLLQFTIMDHLAIVGVMPNLLLILVIVLSFLFNENYAPTYGIIFGTMQDICFSPMIGINALSYFLVYLFIMQIKRFIYRDNVLATLFLVAAATAIHSAVFWSITQAFGGNLNIMYMLIRLPGTIVYNFIPAALFQSFIVTKVIRYRGDRYI